MTDESKQLSDGEGDVAADESDDEHAEATDPTVPQVELSLYQLNVRVSGRATDDLDDVEDSAVRLIDYLIERAETLEDQPDGRGLG
ncbi:hypothetical protein SAMN04487948_10639 [Halogranum amylolyticum]|uniref:Uncharacterized protein n=1 Tax=Halogranum amylolyticum TaxID=660520 RepID=A0A1H8T6W8_9EURY|nr:hypothetical protein [Halogranum amylolyticum]SEO86456.1 hypothetical protein SAMN04487948_10639 [Halogranum amylolyticum]